MPPNDNRLLIKGTYIAVNTKHIEATIEPNNNLLEKKFQLKMDVCQYLLSNMLTNWQ